jgi:hypothetical protein
MPNCTVVAKITGASHDAELTINGQDVPMVAAGGDEWDGAAVLNLPAQAPLVAAVVGITQPWGIEITFTPPRAFANPYKKQNLTSSPLHDIV